MPKPTPTSGNAPSSFFAVTASDSVRLEGLQWLLVMADGDLVLKGVGPGAAARTYPVSAGDWIPFGAGYVMAASTATVDGWA